MIVPFVDQTFLHNFAAGTNFCVTYRDIGIYKGDHINYQIKENVLMRM